LDADIWEELLADDTDQVASVTEVSGGVEVTLETGEYTVFRPVTGLGTTPDNDPPYRLTRSSEWSGNVNPIESGDVRLEGITGGPNSSVIYLPFTNLGDAVYPTYIRYPFYSTRSRGTAAAAFEVANDTNSVVSNVELRGPPFEPKNNVTFTGGRGSKELSLVFDGSVQSQHYFVIEIQCFDGQESLYFVDSPFGGGGESNGNGDHDVAPNYQHSDTGGPL
jgi:hypothetical protein